MHKEASLLKPHTVVCFSIGLGQRAPHPCRECTEKSQALVAEGCRVLPPQSTFILHYPVLYSVPCPGPNGLDL